MHNCNRHMVCSIFLKNIYMQYVLCAIFSFDMSISSILNLYSAVE